MNPPVEIFVPCPICDTFGNSDVVYPSNLDISSFTTQVFSARRLPDRQHYRWVRCKTCTLLRSDPILDADLEELYSTSTFDYSSEIDGLKNTYLNLVIQALNRNFLGKSLFEVGGGNGFFLEAARDKGFGILAGVEPSKDAISRARPDVKPTMIESMMKEGVLPHDSFEIGVMFHTLDHLPDPVLTLKTCLDVLRKDGIFIVAVHNERSWSARLFRKHSPIIDVEHTHLYTRKTAEELFKKIGFIEVRSGSYINQYSLAYILHLLPISRTLRKKILDTHLGKILSRLRVSLPLGNIWVSGKKP